MTPNIQKAPKRGHQGEDTTALKIAYVSWLIDPTPSKGSQAAWAKAHDLNPVTVSTWKDDEFVASLIEKAEPMMRRDWVRVTAALLVAATDPDHPQFVAAASLLAKAWGKIQPDKLQVSVDRVAYVQPGALRTLALDEFPELRPN